ncbi:hypothetical protein SS50377_22975 [Spironucleus salmonicida]|uniref:Uncharacterized protein n=1 Tax=Spironucleus salmonicida TaxID=348837 RepID=V6M3U2_9EUKA|nr:hypothetical protein SS50377_22975 [Spironucleus salmonicida]|eukprot:EST47979.1 Hypothetical protein SS50377_11893 [Spironucleus salmonicida]
MQKQSSDNGFLCDEILFYQDYQEAVKYWEGKYEFQPLRAPGVIFEQEIIFPIFDLDLSQLSAYIAAILEQFNIFLEILIQDLQDLVVIDYDNVKNTIIQYANLLKNENLVKLYPPLSQLLVLLISEIYQLNELEVSARKKEKKYENIILIQSQYQYLMKSNQLSFQLPDLTYIQIFQSEIQYQENLKNSMRILQGKQQQNSQIYEDTEMKGTSHVFSQSSNPHQIFKIPACKNKLIILSALAKLIMLNKNGDEMLDEMDLSVGMVRFIVASIFQNENYNNTLRNKVSHKLEFQNNNLDVSYVIYPAAVQSNIFHQLNNSLNISSCYPLSLLDLKTSIQPLPRIKKLSTFVKNLQRIQNNSGYEFIGLYEHSSLTLHQFCIPFDFKDYPLRNLLSLLKSSSCIIVYIFQPSISLLLYSIISQTPKKQLGLNILKLISNEISKNPLLCKQEVILLLLRSFCIIGQTMLQRNLKIDEIVLDFINIFISIIPITELAILIMDVSSEYQEDTVPETLEKRFTDCNNIIDIQYGNKYAVHPQQLNRLNYIVDFLLFCRDSYLQNLEIQDTITSNHVTTLTNQLIIFRFADKGYITKLLQTANIIISKIDIKSIFRKQDMLQLLLQRKQQLISFLIQVQDFAEATGFTDPRIMVLDINMLFFIELRNDYYSERIHRTGNKLMHCFQDQVLKLQSLVEQSIQNSKLEFFAPLLADRLSVAMVLCGTPQSQFSQQYFSVSSLCLDD